MQKGLSSSVQTLKLRDALDGSAPLVRLMEQLRETQGRLQTVRACLPPGLQDQVKAGTMDDKGWVLLARNPAAAAKLRQLLPRLEEALVAADWQPRRLQIRLTKETSEKHHGRE